MTGMARSDNLDQLIERRQRLEARQTAEPEFAQRLQELRAWQAARLAQTYQDLRRDPQLSPAVEFFLSDLYGPQDFTRRNLELTRAWRYLKRALPEPALEVLGQAIELEVLTVELDQAMLAQLPPGPIDRATYAAAYRALGLPDARQHQIDLIIGIGEALKRIAKRPWIGLALRAAHAPAHAAGFGVLQDFIERGFAGFRRVQDAQRLLQTIRLRETQLLEALLCGSENPFDALTPQQPQHV
jgi:hypothetical protein